MNNENLELVELDFDETLEILSKVDSVSLSSEIIHAMEDAYCNYLYTKNDIIELAKAIHDNGNKENVIEKFQATHTRRENTNVHPDSNETHLTLVRYSIGTMLSEKNIHVTNEELEKISRKYIKDLIEKNLCKVLKQAEPININTGNSILDGAINGIINERSKKDDNVETVECEVVVEPEVHNTDVIISASEEDQNKFYTVIKDAYTSATTEQRSDIDKYIISKSSSRDLTNSDIEKYLDKLNEIIGTSQPEVVVDDINNNLKGGNSKSHKSHKQKERGVVKNPKPVSTESDVVNVVEFPPVVSLTQSVAPRKINADDNNDIINHVDDCDHNHEELNDMTVPINPETSQSSQNTPSVSKAPTAIKMVGISCDPVILDGYYQTGLQCSDNPMILSVIADEFVEIPGTPEIKSAVIIGQIIRCTLSQEEYYSLANNGFKFHFDCGLSNKIITGYAIDPSGMPHTEMYYVEVKDYTSDSQIINANVNGDNRTNLA